MKKTTLLRHSRNWNAAKNDIYPEQSRKYPLSWILSRPTVQIHSIAHAKFRRVQRNWYPYVGYPASATVNNGGDRAKLIFNGRRYPSDTDAISARFSIVRVTFLTTSWPAKKPVNKVTHAEQTWANVTYQPNFQIDAERKWPRWSDDGNGRSMILCPPLLARQRWSTSSYPEAG